MEQLLSDDLITQIKQVFEKLENPVHVFLFVSKDKQDQCESSQQLLEELVSLSFKLDLSVHDIGSEPDLARLYRVQDKAPAIVIAAKEAGQVTDYGIRLLGVPSGYEFSTLIQDLLLVSARDSGLSHQMRSYVKSLTTPLHLQVFVTPT
jgi:alkyl hydroperoxide reductase subunit AhpF